MHPRVPIAPRALARGPAAVLGVLALALALGCASAQPPPSFGAEPAPYRLGPPDQIEITIFPEPLITRAAVVRPDGKISVDLIGDVQAAGRTPEEVAQDIEQRIARYKRDPKVTVAVQAARSTQITVLGEVNQVSTFPVERTTRIVEAIGQVGGPTEFAAQSRIRVIRFDGERTHVFQVDLDAIREGDLTTNMILQEGDLIVVPPTTWASIGHFMRALFYPFQQIFGFGAQVTTRVFTGGAL